MEQDKLIYVAGWFGVIVLALLPLAWSLGGDVKYYDLLPPLLGIIFAMIFDHWNGVTQRANLRAAVTERLDRLQGDASTSFSSLHQDITVAFKDLHEDVTTNCGRAISKSQAVTSFSVQDAHQYVAINAQRAVTMYNTRLARRDYEARAAGYWQHRDRQDQGIKEAIKTGLIYHLVYDVSHEDDIKKFVSEIVAGNPTGIINYYVVDVHGVPLVQFIVLKYRDFSECLLGYGAGDEIANAETVFLIRNDAVCEYLIQVFNVYRRLMEPSLKSPSGPRLPEGPVGPPSTA